MQRSLDIRMAVPEKIWKNETEVLVPPHRYNNDARGNNRIIPNKVTIDGISTNKESSCD